LTDDSAKIAGITEDGVKQPATAISPKVIREKPDAQKNTA
jgi:hypothetical protein